MEKSKPDLYQGSADPNIWANNCVWVQVWFFWFVSQVAEGLQTWNIAKLENKKNLKIAWVWNLVSSVPSKNCFLILAIKYCAKANFNVFCFCPVLLDFFAISQIFSLWLSVETILCPKLVPVSFKLYYCIIFPKFKSFLKHLMQIQSKPQTSLDKWVAEKL